MSFRVVCMASAVVSVLFGLAFLLVPGLALPGYRIGLGLGPPDAQHLSLARSFGAALLTTAALAWGVRDLADAAIQRSNARGVALVMMVAALTQAYAILSGAVNALGWSGVAVYAVFALLWARLGWAR